MNYLLDTNVLCEPTKPKPNGRVMEWLAVTDEDRLYLSAVTLAEVQRGVSRMPSGVRRERIRHWLEHDVFERFGDRILSVDSAVGLQWGKIMAEAEVKGKAMSSLDGFIAATAVVRDLTLATRNVADFKDAVPQVVNPWE